MRTRHLRRWTALLATGTALSTLVGGAAGATTIDPAPPPPTAPVDTGSGDQTDPHLDGTLVSYTSEEGGGSVIRWRDLATGAAGQIPNAGEFDYLSSVSGRRIAYTRVTDRSVVRVHDLATGIDVGIDDVAGANDRAPSIGGGTVAFQRLGPESPSPGASAAAAEIVVHDLATGTTTRLTDDAFLDKNPEVSPGGDVVVWVKCATLATGCDVWRAVRTATGWSAAAVSGAGGEESLPDTDGDVVVFASSRPSGGSTEQDIEVVRLDGGPSRRLELPSVQRHPNVADGIVIFEDFDLDALNYDLAAWELGPDRVRVLTSTPVDESLNTVSVGADGTVRSVWTTNGGGASGFDISSTAFARTPTTPRPAVAATVRQPVDADGSSTFNAKRGVVPLKFSVTRGGAPTCDLPAATIAVTRLGAAPTTVDEAVYASASDQGSTFRIESCQYHDNLAARSLGAGRYRVDVLVGGTPIGSATFALA